MHLTLAQWILLGVLLFIGSAIQSAIGFAFGLFVVPTLLLMGLKPYEAIAIVGVCALMQTSTAVWRNRAEAPWRSVLPFVVVAIALQPVGVWLLSKLVRFDPATIKQVFGCILLAAIAAQGWFRPRPRERLHPAWGVVAFAASGLLSGLSGMGGPPLVLWVMAHDWTSKRSRLSLWIIFLTLLPTNLVLQWLNFGRPVVVAAGYTLLFLPVVLLGALPGHWLGHRLPKPVLRRVAIGLLMAIAAYAIVQPVLMRSPESKTPTPPPDPSPVQPI